MKRSFVRLLLAVVALAAACSAFAQPYPNRPVKLVVPFAAGSGSDIFARLMAEDLRHAFNQSFIVENKPGASAQIDLNLKKASKDEYALQLSNAEWIATNHWCVPLYYAPQV